MENEYTRSVKTKFPLQAGFQELPSTELPVGMVVYDRVTIEPYFTAEPFNADADNVYITLAKYGGSVEERRCWFVIREK